MLIEFHHVKKSYGRKTILSDVTFGIETGEIFGIIGKSGSGKTTILKILNGICPIDYGRVLFKGVNISKELRELRKETGFAAQKNTLFEELSIYENSFYFAKLYGIKRRDIKRKFQELINLFNLKGFENYLIKNLSGGMIKRANLLVSLMHSPSLLILDEPTVGLDPFLRKNLWSYIRQINSFGVTILVTSHLIEEIEKNCDSVAILNNGTIVASLKIEEYKQKYGDSLSLEEIFKGILENHENINYI